MIAGLLRVMENLESHGISFCHFPGLESHGMYQIIEVVMESHGISIHYKKFVCVVFKSDVFLQMQLSVAVKVASTSDSADYLCH